MPDGRVMWAKFVYREIVAPERLVWVLVFGRSRRPDAASAEPDWPLEMLTTVMFEDEAAARQKLTLRWSPMKRGVQKKTNLRGARMTA